METVNSLREMCFPVIAVNAYRWETEAIKDLPRDLLADLARYLTAADLNRLHDVFTAVGVDTTKEWRALAYVRWRWMFTGGIKDISMYRVFYDEFKTRLKTKPRTVYMDLHMHDIFMWHSPEKTSGTDDPKMKIREIPRSDGELPAEYPGTSVAQQCDDLVFLANFAEILQVDINMIRNILQNNALLTVLQKSVQRLRLCHITEEDFEDCRNLSRYLLTEGQVREVLLLNCHELKTESVNEMLSYLNSPTPQQALIPNAAEGLSRKQNSPASSSPEGEMKHCAVALTCMMGRAPPHWQLETCLRPAFQKLGKFSLWAYNFNKPFGSCEDLEQALCDGIEKNRLTHLVLIGYSPTEKFLDELLTVFLNKVRKSPMSQLTVYHCFKQPTQEISDELLAQLEVEHRKFHGVVRLDFADDGPIPASINRIFPLMISHDVALRHLKLMLNNEHNVLSDLLDAVAANGGLESLSLDGNFAGDVWQTKLISVLPKVPSLKKLNIAHCQLTADFVSSAEFTECIRHHSSLVKLDVSQNKLGDAACSLLKAICRTPGRTRFETLNIRYNDIDADSLMSAAQDITSFGQQLRFLRKLRIGEEGFEITNKREIVRQFTTIGHIAGYVDTF